MIARYGVVSKDQVIIIAAPNPYCVLRDGKIEYLPVIGYYIQVRHGMPSFLQLRGFAPIGILEYWNDGIMGPGEM